MDDDRYSAYIVSRRGSKPHASRRTQRRRSHRAAGLLITVLLILTAVICLLVFFLPKLTSPTGADTAIDFGGRTFYLLATAKTDERVAAELQAKSAADRGGAGYVYNDGSYNIIAALYERESDAKTLVTVNQDSYYFALSVPAVACGEGDKRALDFVTGELCATLSELAVDLDRGNITEEAAEHAVSVAMNKTAEIALGVENERLHAALTETIESSHPTDRSVLSGVRFIQVQAIVAVREIYV